MQKNCRNGLAAKKGDSWYCQFLRHGKRHTLTVGKVPPEEAEAKAGQIDYLLMRIKQGYLHLPDGMDIVTFLEFDGKPPEQTVEQKPLSLKDLRERYLETHGNGSLERTTLEGIEIHFRHLATTLHEYFPIQELTLADLQRHVDRRAKMKGHKGRLSPATIRKEIVTLRTARNWAVLMGLLTGKFPYQGLRYPKFMEKPPFQTWEEIERRVNQGGLKQADIQELWDARYLTLPEIQSLLGHVKQRAVQPWVYPVFCFAAHTGARRSEMIRALVSDVDFDRQTILIHEKKRTKGKTTTRRVRLTPFLAGVLREWLEVHPGGQNLFSHSTDEQRKR